MTTAADGEWASDRAIEGHAYVKLWRLAEVPVGPVLGRDVNTSDAPARRELDGLDVRILPCDGLPHTALDQLEAPLLKVKVAGCSLRGLSFGVAPRLDEALPFRRS